MNIALAPQRWNISFSIPGDYTSPTWVEWWIDDPDELDVLCAILRRNGATQYTVKKANT